MESDGEQSDYSAPEMCVNVYCGRKVGSLSEKHECVHIPSPWRCSHLSRCVCTAICSTSTAETHRWSERSARYRTRLLTHGDSIVLIEDGCFGLPSGSSSSSSSLVLPFSPLDSFPRLSHHIRAARLYIHGRSIRYPSPSSVSLRATQA
jgi:hypothetical protein